MLNVSFYLLQPDRYQKIADRILNRFGNDAQSMVPIKRISLPDITKAMNLGRQEPFSLFIPRHREIAAFLITIFLGE